MSENDRNGPMLFGVHPAIYCPRCGKCATQMQYDWKTNTARYLHFTKKRSKWHTVTLDRS